MWENNNKMYLKQIGLKDMNVYLALSSNHSQALVNTVMNLSRYFLTNSATINFSWSIILSVVSALMYPNAV
jgi:hypothetical protein